MSALPAREALLETWAAQREVEQFLFHEAALADAHDYQGWFALWAEELLYWVPAGGAVLDPKRRVSLIYDDRSRLDERIFRLGTGLAHSQRPPSKLLRTVSNIQLEDCGAHGATVSSRFLIGELRRDHENWWIGRAKHVLVRVGGKLLMKEKHVFLLKNSAPIGNLTFLL